MDLFGICSVIEVLKYIQSLHSSSRLFNTFLFGLKSVQLQYGYWNCCKITFWCIQWDLDFEITKDIIYFLINHVILLHLSISFC